MSLNSIEAEFDFFPRGVVVGRDGLQPIAADLALYGRSALLASTGASLPLSFTVLGTTSTDLSLHFGDFDRELAVE